MTTSGTLTVRPLATDEEIDTFCYLATETFSPPGGDTATDARLWRRYVEALPEFDPRQLRGVFDGEVFAGGCIIYERELCAGEARLRTACIGGVVTHPEHRLRGVGTALMRDAITFAERHGHALLLLDGIPNFYHRWGYTDIYDLTEHIIERAAVAALPATGCTTRPATLDDAPALLALYQRHYSRYTGSFTRTLEQQRVRLERSRDRGNPPVLAEDAAGNALGYLMLPSAGDRVRAGEVAASTWPAAAALLQHHAHIVEAQAEAPASLTWPLPPDSYTCYLLADHLDVTAATPDNDTRTSVVRSETYIARRTAWMARPVSPRRIVEALLPVWQARLASARRIASMSFTLRTGDEVTALSIVDSAVQLLPIPAPDSLEAVLTPAQLVQLLFGYRPVSYLAAQPDTHIPESLLPVLDTLFPAGQAWIPWSDSF
ncbi:MAG TPA: GNAT family N-acetyltransferase [Ktedonobacterales bacterium]|nr:GNAT family N-acetyltransferase [Ktedonobacterales bacterium]